jgi:hypothetical protein
VDEERRKKALLLSLFFSLLYLFPFSSTFSSISSLLPLFLFSSDDALAQWGASRFFANNTKEVGDDTPPSSRLHNHNRHSTITSPILPSATASASSSGSVANSAILQKSKKLAQKILVDSWESYSKEVRAELSRSSNVFIRA